MSKFSILVISDLHTGISINDGDDTKLLCGVKHNNFDQVFIDYISNLNLDIDLMICPGDIGNKGINENFKAGWEFINKVAKNLNIRDLLCVPGNHDHQSRQDDGKNGFSPKHDLQFTKPPFPFDDFDKNTHFWAWNWVYTTNEKYNSILINSSAYHGFKSEYEHGRIAIEVCNQIKEKIRQKKENNEIEEKSFNILLCHHHLEKMEFVDVKFDGQVMEGAQYLLKSLEDLDIGPWIIIHGHKHYASIRYASSASSSSPVIMAAGSLSAELYETIQDRTSNQFYILDIDIDKCDEWGKVVGNFRTYEYNPIKGWQPSNSKNLPAIGGFGGVNTVRQVMNKIKKQLSNENPFIEGEELDCLHDEIKYMAPDDLYKLEVDLKKNKISLVKDTEGNVIQLGFSNE